MEKLCINQVSAPRSTTLASLNPASEQQVPTCWPSDSDDHASSESAHTRAHHGHAQVSTIGTATLLPRACKMAVQVKQGDC